MHTIDISQRKYLVHKFFDNTYKYFSRSRQSFPHFVWVAAPIAPGNDITLNRLLPLQMSPHHWSITLNELIDFVHLHCTCSISGQISAIEPVNMDYMYSDVIVVNFNIVARTLLFEIVLCSVQ